MSILLIAGEAHPIVTQYVTKAADIINRASLDLSSVQNMLNEESPSPKGVLITDDALSGHEAQDERALSELLAWMRQNCLTMPKVILITRNPLLEDKLRRLSLENADFKIVHSGWVRVPAAAYRSALQELLSKSPPVRKSSPIAEAPAAQREVPTPAKEPEKKKSFFDRFKSKPQQEPVIQATDPLTREIANISRGISRIVAVTGHRGSGVTSTVVNLASEASRRGLSSIIIDMDVDYRSMNMYFSSFHERTKRSEEINASLIRTLARPQDYMTTAFNVKENMWLTGLGYDFHDGKLMSQFYNTAKLVGMLSLLRTKFNLVLLDLPLDLFRMFSDALIHIDLFGLCVPNNLHAVLSTIRNVETILDKENAHYLNAKSKIIVTQYNSLSRFQGDLFTPDKVGEVITSGLSEKFIYEMSIAGQVPYSPHFDSQIENDIPLVHSGSEYEKAFGQLLLRIMEGA
ncbi:hypothetical protein [Paenibacillus sp. CAA11]|uniref:hypothetical protein n=1 Tax=Paenibacillus sp. CAA11 TaxID=1532905 RepID=UPI00131F36FC|nr:hypothetical protein [Paenibacillus sp. CAA11]